MFFPNSHKLRSEIHHSIVNINLVTMAKQSSYVQCNYKIYLYHGMLILLDLSTLYYLSLVQRVIFPVLP